VAARGSDDRLLRRRQQRNAETLKPFAILVAMGARVIGHVHDPVARIGAPAQQLGDARDRVAAAVNDAIKIYKQKHGRMV